MKPLVSVLMTAYNREKYIAEAIESVLASSYTNFELIIVDDCSKDKTVEIAKEFEKRDNRIKVYINEKNIGDYPNRNKAANYAKGKYLKYVDSDDMVYKHGLEIMIDGMEKFPSAAIGIISKTSQDVEPYPYLMSPQTAYTKHFFEDGCFDVGPLALIIQKQYFIEYGGFSGKRYIGDTEFLLGICRKWPTVKLQGSLVFWRKHDEQEIKYEKQTNVRIEQTLKILNENLFAPDCPLTMSQKEIIIKLFKRSAARIIIKKALKERRLGYYLTLWKLNRLKVSDVFNKLAY